MEDKHPIDKLFRDILNDPNIPFDEKEWETLSRKMSPRKKRRATLLIWLGCGAAAAAILAVVMLFGDGQSPIDDTMEYITRSTPTNLHDHTHQDDSTAISDKNGSRTALAPIADISKESIPVTDGRVVASPIREAHHSLAAVSLPPALPAMSNVRPTIRTRPHTVTEIPYRTLAVPVVQNVVASAAAADDPNKRTTDNGRQRGWMLGVTVAPDLSGTQLASGKLGGNTGVMATYRFNNWFSISGGALYARKLYQADFTDYHSRITWNDERGTPDLVAANCEVLDIPINVNIDIKQLQRSSWFASAGISSYFMLREAYNYSYPPHEYGYPKQFTLYNRNRHLLGIGNISVGYQRKLNPSVSLTVQPFVKVPLTGIGNGNLKLYSTGVAISAAIKLAP